MTLIAVFSLFSFTSGVYVHCFLFIAYSIFFIYSIPLIFVVLTLSV